MQLGELGDRKSPSVVQGQSSGRGTVAQRPPEAEAFGIFAHNILYFCPMQDFFAGQREAWPNGKYASASSLNPVPSPSPLLSAPPWNVESPGSSPEIFFLNSRLL